MSKVCTLASLPLNGVVTKPPVPKVVSSDPDPDDRRRLWLVEREPGSRPCHQESGDQQQPHVARDVRRVVGVLTGGELPAAAEATANLLPLKGRARPLAEKSLGTPDPGATSLAMVFAVMGPHFTESIAAGDTAAKESIGAEA